MRRLALIPALLVAALPAPGAAAAGTLGLALEPGVANLARPGEQRVWGVLAGFEAALGVSELLWLRGHVEGKLLVDDPDDRAAVWAASLGGRYDFDTGAVTPFIELGLALVGVVPPPPPGGEVLLPGPEVTAVIGLGLDVRLFAPLLLGVVFRYYPLATTDLLEPAYATIHARVGVSLPLWGSAAGK